MFGRKQVTLPVNNLERLPIYTEMAPLYELHTKQLQYDFIKEPYQETRETTSSIDQLLERYPILDKIVDMFLKYLYNWLMIVDSSLK